MRWVESRHERQRREHEHSAVSLEVSRFWMETRLGAFRRTCRRPQPFNGCRT
jgi:hypothetical protein